MAEVSKMEWRGKSRIFRVFPGLREQNPGDDAPITIGTHSMGNRQVPQDFLGVWVQGFRVSELSPCHLPQKC
jgi:hypothetical protein